MVESSIDAESFFTVDKVSRGDLPALRREVWSAPQPFEEFRAKTDDLAEAIAGTRDAAKKREESFRLACAYWILTRYDDAIDALEEVRTRKEALWLMGACHRANHRAAAALDALEKAARSGEPEFDLVVDLAAAMRDAGDPEGAEKLLDKHGKQGEASADCHYEKALCREVQGDTGGAVELHARALELDPQCAKAAYRLGSLHDRHGDDDRALEYFEMCVEMEQKHTNALLSLGLMYEDRGQNGKAVECFQKVLNADPNHARAQLYYKDVRTRETEYYDEGKEKKASRHQAILDTPISEFELSVRSRNCLEKMNINALGDLTRITEQELLSYKNFGETSLSEIKAILGQSALRLGQAIEDGEAGEEGQETGVKAKLVADINFSARSRRCMERLNIVTLGDLTQYSRRDLLEFPNLGQTSLREIEERLAECDLQFREDDAT